MTWDDPQILYKVVATVGYSGQLAHSATATLKNGAVIPFGEWVGHLNDKPGEGIVFSPSHEAVGYDVIKIRITTDGPSASCGLLRWESVIAWGV
jgi:hypothetical protein